MAGIATIAKKEFVDHVSDRTFLLCFAVLLAAMVGGGYQSSTSAQALIFNDAAKGITYQQGETWKAITYLLTVFVIEPFVLIGILSAIALGFSTVYKERAEGSLKVLLSYPVSRNSVILGKLIGGVTALLFAVLASMAVTFGIVLYYLSIPATGDFIIRIALIAVAGMSPLLFYFFIGMSISTIIHDSLTALVGTVLIFAALHRDILTIIITLARGIFTALRIGIYLPYMNYESSYRPSWDAFNMRSVSLMSPMETFLRFSYSVFEFEGKATPLTVRWDTLLPKNLDLIGALTIYALAGLIVCFVVFKRSDVE